MGWPEQLRSGEYQLYREAEKANEKVRELTLKARPARRHVHKTSESKSPAKPRSRL
jgi:anthraniloyl-CoA monooxygenase